ncbi:nicotinamide-nucleotide amidase [Lacimicrobium sp. SS2-24]|uniref:nicotinamide-nucleotide amidase n=1 Tax=Lacimicrobium sp. SS2-24 TaxID=2005569 RepID=UPI000B4B4BE6|nr:nicotinamide-nucleotide amidase [Lacimicrobium sp. SS2-24]
MNESTLQLASNLGQRLKDNGWKLTCAESCTGGGIGYAITSVSGSSAWFERGFITYSDEAKQQVLGVDNSMLIVEGAVSAKVVEQMASGALKAADADLAIAVSGIAGPDGGSPEKPVGTVWFGFATADRVESLHQRFMGDRHQIRSQSIEVALQKALQLVS